MFRKSGEMLFVFKKDVRYSVWTPFMKFSIDVFFLDGKGKVVEVKRNLKPWKIYKPRKSYRYFFESEAGKYNEREVEALVRNYDTGMDEENSKRENLDTSQSRG